MSRSEKKNTPQHEELFWTGQGMIGVIARILFMGKKARYKRTAHREFTLEFSRVNETLTLIDILCVLEASVLSQYRSHLINMHSFCIACTQLICIIPQDDKFRTAHYC